MQTAGHSTWQNTRGRWACLLFWLANHIPKVCGLVVTSSSSQTAKGTSNTSKGNVLVLSRRTFYQFLASKCTVLLNKVFEGIRISNITVQGVKEGMESLSGIFLITMYLKIYIYICEEGIICTKQNEIRAHASTTLKINYHSEEMLPCGTYFLLFLIMLWW